MTEIRCVKCRRLLMKASNDITGRIEAKCSKCGHLNVYIDGLSPYKVRRRSLDEALKELFGISLAEIKDAKMHGTTVLKRRETV